MSAAKIALNRIELMVEAAREDKKTCPDNYYKGNFNAYEHARDIIKQEIDNEENES